MNEGRHRTASTEALRDAAIRPSGPVRCSGSISLLAWLACAACGDAPPADDPPPPPPLSWPGVGDVRTTDGVLRVHVAGEPAAREVLVTIHGGPGMASDYMVGLDRLATPTEGCAGLAVVRYDQRGGSDSPLDPRCRDYSLDAHVRDLDAVCRAVAGERAVHVLGHSWGGLLAVLFAHRFPSRVKSLALVDSFPPTGAASITADRAFERHMAALSERDLLPSPMPGLHEPGSLRAYLPAYFRDPAFEAPPELREAAFAFGPFALSMEQMNYPDYDVSDEVGQIRCRVLILYGDSDPFGEAMGRAMEAALQRAEVEWFTIPSCGHFWHENPAPFFDKLRAFYGA